MSEAEMNSYRFGTNEDPSDEMLAQIMREVAEDAKRTNDVARKQYSAQLQRGIREQEAKWAERINEIKNGQF